MEGHRQHVTIALLRRVQMDLRRRYRARRLVGMAGAPIPSVAALNWGIDHPHLGFTCACLVLCTPNRDEEFIRGVGLGDLADDGYARIGTNILPPGQRLADGLTEKAARDMGLVQGTPVGVSMIDAHAGGLGVLGPRADVGDLCGRVALIAGTSTCHMAVSPQPVHIPGVWGPYHSAMVPGLWLSEGGQVGPCPTA